jgi:RecJ-like exonuclease
MCLDCGETKIKDICEYGLMKKHCWTQKEVDRLKAELLRISKDRLKNVLDSNFNCYCKHIDIPCSKCKGEGELPRLFSKKKKICPNCKGAGKIKKLEECSFCLINKHYYQGIPYQKKHYRTYSGRRYVASTTTQYKPMTKGPVADAIMRCFANWHEDNPLNYSCCKFCGMNSKWRSINKETIEEHERGCQKNK